MSIQFSLPLSRNRNLQMEGKKQTKKETKKEKRNGKIITIKFTMICKNNQFYNLFFFFFAILELFTI